MRIKSKWYDNQVKSIADIASALAFNTWRLIKNSLEDLINAGFTIEKAQVFDVIAEYACFIIQCTDRLCFSQLSTSKRQELIHKLVKQTALYYQDNKSERIKSGQHWQDFVALYNRRVQDYSEFSFENGEPDYSFYRYFAMQIQAVTTAVDKKWIAQQMIEIQAPKTFKTLQKNICNTLAAVASVADDKPQKPPTSREIRRQVRRVKKGINQNIDINAKIDLLGRIRQTK